MRTALVENWRSSDEINKKHRWNWMFRPLLRRPRVHMWICCQRWFCWASRGAGSRRCRYWSTCCARTANRAEYQPRRHGDDNFRSSPATWTCSSSTRRRCPGVFCISLTGTQVASSAIGMCVFWIVARCPRVRYIVPASFTSHRLNTTELAKLLWARVFQWEWTRVRELCDLVCCVCKSISTTCVAESCADQSTLGVTGSTLRSV